jgi:hypothetical protein
MLAEGQEACGERVVADQTHGILLMQTNEELKDNASTINKKGDNQTLNLKNNNKIRGVNRKKPDGTRRNLGKDQGGNLKNQRSAANSNRHRVSRY